MNKTRLISMFVAFGLVLALTQVPLATPVRAAGETWTVVSAISIGCDTFATGFNVAYSNIDVGADYYQETWVEAGGQVYMDEYLGPIFPSDTTWYLYNSSSRGLQTASFPIPEPATVILRLYDAGENPIYETRLTLNCVAQTYQIVFSGPITPAEPVEPVVEEPVPGCDVLINIPSTAVGAKITADTLAYWAPGQATDTLLKAGTSVRAISQADGWYKILFACDFLYVPVGTIGPNPESPWFGAPLP